MDKTPSDIVLGDTEEAALIAGFKSGDEAALEALIRKYKEPLHRFIYRQVRDEDETADILSQTFIKAYRNRARYRPKAKIQTWLFTIAGNLCRDLARKRKRRPGDFSITSGDEFDERQQAEASERVGSITPAENAVKHEEAEFLKEAISNLPHDLRSAVILCCLEGNSQEEAALSLGCTAKAIETRIYRAKKQLRVMLERVHDDI